MVTSQAAVSQSELVAALSDAVRRALRDRSRLTVGIDGPDGAGKTVLAEALAESLGPLALRASIDGFHHPQDVRLTRGTLSPGGYYRDSFDYEALRSDLLRPFLSGQSRVKTTAYDYRVESETRSFAVGVPSVAALIFDGVFLLRPEVCDDWDMSIYLHVSEEETLRRVVARDVGLFGSPEEALRRYTLRYLPGQAIYRRERDPKSRATVVVDNEEPRAPTIVRWGLGHD